MGEAVPPGLKPLHAALVAGGSLVILKGALGLGWIASISAAACTGLTLLALVVRSASVVPAKFDRREPLLEQETPLVNVLPGVTTVTFFSASDGLGEAREPEGEPQAEGSTESAVAWLEKRVSEIVDANPWLGGYIAKDGKGGTTLCWCSKKSSKQHYKRVTVRAGAPSLVAKDPKSFKSFSKQATPFSVGRVEKGNAKDVLFRVTVVDQTNCTDISDQGIVLIFSVSHILGDGATFYELYKMLDPDEQVQALNPSREQSFGDVMNMYHGPAAARWWERAKPFWGTIMLAARKGIFDALRIASPEPENAMFYLDEKALKRAKTEAIAQCESEKEVKFVSSNDVITSWYINAITGSPDSPFLTGNAAMMMAINFRGKVKTLAHNLAGNYISGVTFVPGASDVTPTGIRYALENPGRNEIGRATKIDSFKPWTIITNWAAFYTKVHLPGGFEADLHIPMIPPYDSLPTINLCVIFDSGRGPAVFASKAPTASTSAILSDHVEYLAKSTSKKSKRKKQEAAATATMFEHRAELFGDRLL